MIRKAVNVIDQETGKIFEEFTSSFLSVKEQECRNHRFIKNHLCQEFSTHGISISQKNFYTLKYSKYSYYTKIIKERKSSKEPRFRNHYIYFP